MKKPFLSFILLLLFIDPNLIHSKTSEELEKETKYVSRFLMREPVLPLDEYVTRKVYDGKILNLNHAYLDPVRLSIHSGKDCDTFTMYLKNAYYQKEEYCYDSSDRIREVKIKYDKFIRVIEFIGRAENAHYVIFKQKFYANDSLYKEVYGAERFEGLPNWLPAMQESDFKNVAPISILDEKLLAEEKSHIEFRNRVFHGTQAEYMGTWQNESDANKTEESPVAVIGDQVLILDGDFDAYVVSEDGIKIISPLGKLKSSGKIVRKGDTLNISLVSEEKKGKKKKIEYKLVPSCVKGMYGEVFNDGFSIKRNCSP
ncbi:hypothetical protein CH371_19250 [Leptospira wolffii]|uniref:Uncharacterized protein n=1 Tax=Leptospira wolffii TaxID=409998 RepID=A0A2M9Z739_9LEPT|nr:hypothetical protein [Leptospira wolffii]PJZ64251.1 hypothetical protein CH371_19250 [Leptospira wolffii]